MRRQLPAVTPGLQHGRGEEGGCCFPMPPTQRLLVARVAASVLRGGAGAVGGVLLLLLLLPWQGRGVVAGVVAALLPLLLPPLGVSTLVMKRRKRRRVTAMRRRSWRRAMRTSSWAHAAPAVVAAAAPARPQQEQVEPTRQEACSRMQPCPLATPLPPPRLRAAEAGCVTEVGTGGVITPPPLWPSLLAVELGVSRETTTTMSTPKRAAATSTRTLQQALEQAAAGVVPWKAARAAAGTREELLGWWLQACLRSVQDPQRAWQTAAAAAGGWVRGGAAAGEERGCRLSSCVGGGGEGREAAAYSLLPLLLLPGWKTRETSMEVATWLWTTLTASTRLHPWGEEEGGVRLRQAPPVQQVAVAAAFPSIASLRRRRGEEVTLLLRQGTACAISSSRMRRCTALHVRGRRLMQPLLSCCCRHSSRATP
jgi:hypothetical protein